MTKIGQSKPISVLYPMIDPELDLNQCKRFTHLYQPLKVHYEEQKLKPQISRDQVHILMILEAIRNENLLVSIGNLVLSKTSTLRKKCCTTLIWALSHGA